MRADMNPDSGDKSLERPKVPSSAPRGTREIFLTARSTRARAEIYAVVPAEARKGYRD